MTTVKAVNEFILGGRNIRKWNPGIFGFRKIFPANKIFETVTNLASVMDGLDGESGVVGEVERFWGRVRSEIGGVAIGFKQGNIKDRVKTRKVGREVEEIG
jgi:hypothetical protein